MARPATVTVLYGVVDWLQTGTANAQTAIHKRALKLVKNTHPFKGNPELYFYHRADLRFCNLGQLDCIQHI